MPAINLGSTVCFRRNAFPNIRQYCTLPLSGIHMITSQSTNWSTEVQKNAARFVTGNYLWSTSSSGLVSSLGWCTLEQRRLLNMTLLFFKFHNNLIGSQIPPEFAANQRYNRRHGLTYRQVQTNLLCYSFSFFPRTIRLWNNLPRVAVNATSFDSFRNAVQKAIPNLKVPCHPILINFILMYLV